MDELVSTVSKKTGLSAAMAKVAVNLVVDFIKNKLPAPLGAQIDAITKGQGTLGAAENMFGGLLGGAKKATAAPRKAPAAPKKATAAPKKSTAVAKKTTTASKKTTSSAKKAPVKKTGKK